MAPYKSIFLITLITVIVHMIFLPAGVANPPQPRLYFDASGVDSLRQKIMREPFKRMVEKLLSLKDKNHWGVADYNPENVYDISTMAENYAFLYILTGEESYAQVSREKTGQLIRSEIAAFPWASRSVKGLTSYWMGRRIAHSYDWCKSSQSWDEAFCDSVSTALIDMGNMIIDYGGTEQNTSVNSNWQGNRGAAAGLCLLASDDDLDDARLTKAYNKVVQYINSNVTTHEQTRGWIPEGLGYAYYPVGNFTGPFGIAMARHDSLRDIRTLPGTAMIYWSMYATLTNVISRTAPDNALHTVKPDMVNDGPGTAGEGSYGQAFYYMSESMLPGIKYWYDRHQGHLSPYGPIWDMTRNGIIWSILYYPDSLPSVNPIHITEWVRAFDDQYANGMFVFRNNYLDANDHVVQYNAKLRHPGGHRGADGMSFRIIAEGTPFVVGGGRNNPGNRQNQPTVYPTNPGGDVASNNNLSSITGTPFIDAHGGGHVIAEIGKNNVGTNDHKRWFIANFDKEETGANGTYVIADQSSDGRYFQIPTFAGNSISFSDHSFMIVSDNGATMKGTVLYPTSNLRFETSIRSRGSAYGTYDHNRTIHFQSADGTFLVVLTINPGREHPPVNLVANEAGIMNGSRIRVGDKVFTLGSDTISYGTYDEQVAVRYQGTFRSRVYPNPASSLITIEANLQKGHAIIYSLHGIEVLRKFLDGQVSHMDLSHLPKGIYVLTLTDFTSSESHKLILQ